MRAFRIDANWPPPAGWEDQQRKRCESELLDDICATLVRIGDEATQNTLEALTQLDAGTYGYCVDCHQQIPAERLDTVNFAVRCAPCAHAHEAAISEGSEGAEDDLAPMPVASWQ